MRKGWREGWVRGVVAWVSCEEEMRSWWEEGDIAVRDKEDGTKGRSCPEKSSIYIYLLEAVEKGSQLYVVKIHIGPSLQRRTKIQQNRDNKDIKYCRHNQVK